MLGLPARHDSLTARRIADQLNLKDTTAISPWLDRLVERTIRRQIATERDTK